MYVKAFQVLYLVILLILFTKAESTLQNYNTTLSPKVDVSQRAPLSDKRYCGYQHTDDYVYTGNDTSIDEFPWLAVFIYQVDPDLDQEGQKPFVQFGCSGTIINARYVITAAQCLRLEIASAVAVRLGEYNIKNEEDCTKFSDIDDCSNPVEDVEFEKTIVHPKYNRRIGIHDIALIRLKKRIFFTDFIRPICLPIPGTKLAEPGEILTTTGFGRVAYMGNYTIIKKKILTKLITNEECSREFMKFTDRLRNVTENIICATDLNKNTAFSCEGDSGAPLMVSRKAQWHVEGFAVWGVSMCGPEYPGAYTKVVNYLDWIKENMEP